MLPSEEIKAKAADIGFDACGITPAGFLREDKEILSSWLNKGYCSGMSYMKNHFDKRLNPSLLVENTRSVIVVLLNYYPEQLQDKSYPQIAKYAYGKDYHIVIKQKLYELLNALRAAFPDEKITGRAFVDSAPVLERSLAQRAGLGWIGKNTTLINPQLGSFTFIGELMINAEVDFYDKPIENHCGNCTKCLDACPTNALCEAYTLDANRCFSYQTIENKEDIPEEIQKKLGNRLFGCDSCQQVCPYNKQVKASKTKDFFASPEILTMDKKSWQNITVEQFKSLFADSPLQRAGYEKIKATLKYFVE